MRTWAGIVSVLGLLATACGADDGGEDGGGTTAASASAEGSGSSAADGSTGGSGSSTGGSSSSSSGAGDTADDSSVLPMCEAAKEEAMCMATAGCIWNPAPPGTCEVRCDWITHEAPCVDHGCVWDGANCADG